MRVILTKDVKSQGKRGDEINVSDGYANNFLFRNNLAVPANKANVNANNKEKAEQAKKIAEDTAAAKAVAERLKDVKLKFLIEVGERGKAFGSIGSKEISEKLAELGFDVDKKDISIEGQIKREGVYEAEIKLYRGVTAKIEVVVSAK